MWDRLRLSRPAVLLLVAFVAVPALLWAHLVWTTRPYSEAEVAADRARVEQSQEYADAVEACWAESRSTGDTRLDRNLAPLGTACMYASVEAWSSLDRESLTVSAAPGDTATVAVLAMAATAGLAGVLHGRPRDVRSLLRRAAAAFGIGLWTACLVQVLWWWGLAWVVGRRGGEDAAGWLPHDFMGHGGLLVAGAAAAGVAVGAVLRRPERAAVLGALGAVAAGVVLLATPAPLDPLMPGLNVTAWLHDGEDYLGSDEQCSEVVPPMWTGYGFGDARDAEVVCTRSVTHTSGDAAAYLSGLLAALLVMAVLAVWHPSGRRPGGFGPPSPPA